MDKLNDRITTVSVEPKCRLWLREHRHDGWTWDVHNTGTTPMTATIPGDKNDQASSFTCECYEGIFFTSNS